VGFAHMHTRRNPSSLPGAAAPRCDLYPPPPPPHTHPTRCRLHQHQCLLMCVRLLPTEWRLLPVPGFGLSCGHHRRQRCASRCRRLRHAGATPQSKRLLTRDPIPKHARGSCKHLPIPLSAACPATVGLACTHSGVGWLLVGSPDDVAPPAAAPHLPQAPTASANASAREAASCTPAPAAALPTPTGAVMPA
jgi:hypothetical protein